MVVRAKRKVRRQRGSRSHGWGKQKDHKEAGMRGGRGNAGVTQHHWIRTIIRAKEAGVKPLGKYGFKRPQEFQKKYETVNVSQLDQSVDTLVSAEKVKLENDTYVINLTEMGVVKLLAQGNITRKLEITVNQATDRAVSKVEKAGGKVILPKKCV